MQHVAQLYQNLKAYINNGIENTDKDLDKLIKIVSIVKTFMSLIFNQIEKIGIVNIEFLAKSEMFLKAVTISYSKDNLKQILTTLKAVDENIDKTLFFHKINSIRAIITNDFEGELYIYNNQGNLIITLSKSEALELSFFTASLIEAIIKFCHELRKERNAKFMKSIYFRYRIQSQFINLVKNTIDTVKSVKIC